MPWEVTYPVRERKLLVRAFATGRYTITELAEAFGVSRKTAAKWIHRSDEEGPDGLLDRSIAPHRHPNEEMIIVQQGTVEVFSEGTKTRVGPGSVIFHASNHLHGLTNVGDTPATYHVINWQSSTTPPAANE